MGSTNLENYRSSLTLEEFQHALAGSNLGSMNMDELLRNVWSAQEGQAMAAAMRSLEGSNNSGQLPRTLSSKGIEDVWKTLQSSQEDASHQRQITAGEVTLEDFLVKAGIVSDKVPAQPNQAAITMPFGAEFSGQRSSNGNNNREVEFRNGRQTAGHASQFEFVPKAENSMASLPLMKGMRYDGPPIIQQSGAQENTWRKDIPFRKIGTQQEQQVPSQQFAQQNTVGYNTGVMPNVNNGGTLKPSINASFHPAAAGDRVGGILSQGIGFNPGNNLSFSFGDGSELSPSLDEASYGTVNAALSLTNQQGIPGQRGRKRCIEAPIEKVIERRQRRMIKNRESAARSRARKQAYTVELEAEVNQLKEENMELLRKQKEEFKRRKEQILDVMASTVPKTVSDRYSLRRTHTGPW